jgi:hypothetical protein
MQRDLRRVQHEPLEYDRRADDRHREPAATKLPIARNGKGRRSALLCTVRTG